LVSAFFFVPTEPGHVRQITTSYFLPAPNGAEEEGKAVLKGNQIEMSRIVLKGRTLESVKQPRKGPIETILSWVCTRWPELSKVRQGLKNLKTLNGRLGDQDNVILAFQGSVGIPAVHDRTFRAPAISHRYGGPPSEYVLETHADALVAEFDAWLAARGGGPFGMNEYGSSTPLKDEDLMDRWTRHTMFNPDTSAALDFIGKLVILLETRGTPGSLGCTALCLALGAVRAAAVPALLAAVSLTFATRLRRVAHSFVSGLPPSPSVPVTQLWER